MATDATPFQATLDRTSAAVKPQTVRQEFDPTVKPAAHPKLNVLATGREIYAGQKRSFCEAAGEACEIPPQLRAVPHSSETTRREDDEGESAGRAVQRPKDPSTGNSWGWDC